MNDAVATAIIDTGSPVTVISQGLFERMGEEFEENSVVLKSNLKIPSVKIFSCEIDKAMDTLGQCDVLLKHDKFECVSPVIVAVDLAHDCLIGMNVLMLWPTIREAIEVLMRANTVKDKIVLFDPDSRTTRLNNACLPRILSDFDIERMRPNVNAIQYNREATQSTPVDQDSMNLRDKTSENPLLELDEEVELALVVEEQEFKESFLTEKHL